MKNLHWTDRALLVAPVVVWMWSLYFSTGYGYWAKWDSVPINLIVTCVAIRWVIRPFIDKE